MYIVLNNVIKRGFQYFVSFYYNIFSCNIFIFRISEFFIECKIKIETSTYTILHDQDVRHSSNL